MNKTNNQRIAKNTFMLFTRMIVLMLVTLYTSRIILNVLGVIDYGIYNLVAGVVTSLSFLNSSMSSATQRFLSYELGAKNTQKIKMVFSMSVNIHIIIAVLILIISETIGLWVLNNSLKIPSERLVAANWVYQFSILTFIVNIISVPYNAAIITYEKMNVFALISVFEVVLKLIAVFILEAFGYDKLQLYAILIFSVSFIIRIIYGQYTKRNIKDCCYIFTWDKCLFKTLLSYSSWNLWGNIASVGFNSGIDILLNIFFGPMVNAAKGIAYQVNYALSSFLINFQTAMNPQIIKSYAAENYDYMIKLVFTGARLSYYLMLLISLPLILSTPQIVHWWLGKVPDYTIVFCRLIIINTLINSISGTLMTGVQATGKIKLYQSVVGGLLLLIVPISYVFLKFGYPPQTTFYVYIALSITSLFARIAIISPILKIPKVRFTKDLLLPIFFISIGPLTILLLLNNYSENNFNNFIFLNLILFSTTLTIIYFFGLKKEEKEFIASNISSINKKFKLLKK